MDVAQRFLPALLRRLWLGLTHVLQAVFGAWDYQPPAWVAALGRGYMRHPRRYSRILLGIASVALGAHWWVHRPPPPDVPIYGFSVSAPRLTNYDEVPPRPRPLIVDFAGSVAPLAAVDQVLTQGIEMDPPVAGSWRFSGDDQLRFEPLADWPVGARIEVRFHAEQLIRPQVLLSDDTFAFETAALSLSTTSSEFYQDPIDPKIKKAVFVLSGSHPIDAGTLDSRIRLLQRDQLNALQGEPKFTVSYDNQRRRVSIVSEPLTLPENGGHVALTVSPGATAVAGGPEYAEEITAAVDLPGSFSLALSEIDTFIVDNSDGSPEQVLMLRLNHDVSEQNLRERVHAYLLPRQHPDPKQQARMGSGDTPYSWSADEVSEAILDQSQVLSLQLIDGEREVAPAHSFRFEADPNRRLLVRVDKGLTSFGGFVQGKTSHDVVVAPDFPKLTRFVGDGVLLSLQGEQRVTVALRNVREAELTVARVKAGELHHLVQFNESGLRSPSLSGISADDLSERFHHRIVVPETAPGSVHYEGVDLSGYWSGNEKGVFLLSVREIAPGTTLGDDPQRFSSYDDSGYYEDESAVTSDRRLVNLTDLGIISKTDASGSRDVFVQHLSSGQPADATVRVVARNGSEVMRVRTDGSGRARLDRLDGLKRERTPVMIQVESAGDQSFLPLNDGERDLDYSRFDIGGLDSGIGTSLQAHLFSDRGLYRPGDTANFGLIVRSPDFSIAEGLPLRILITDARGAMVKEERLALDRQGFLETSLAISDFAPSGDWQVELSRVFEYEKSPPRFEAIGSTSFRVKEFLPDRMKLKATLSQESPQGFVSPDDLRLRVLAENLIGTPAQERRTTGRMWLSPTVPSFAAWPGYHFHDERSDYSVQESEIGERNTDAEGKAEFELGLQNIASPTFTLNLVAEVFEADGGRSVTTRVSSLVSRAPYLVGMRSADSLDFVPRGADRSVDVIAIGADGKLLGVNALSAVVIERRYVSVLTQQSNGLYRYQSVLKEIPVSNQPIDLKTGRASLVLPTTAPGNFVLMVRDESGSIRNSQNFQVAGEGNLARSLDRNAELSLKLGRPQYAPGDEIEVNVVAPYAGSGLITIERDTVLAHAWFRAETNASVQRIRVPAGLTGNAYVNVQFLRDPQSADVFMSPMSYGVVPFTVDRAPNTASITLTAPEISKPGTVLPITLRSDGPVRVAVFAVDEGILQVANYQLADPLDTFFAKKRLQVSTAQILDLMLPEFSRLVSAAAPGGDGEGALARQLNPFKRKTDKPAVFWSGLTDVDGTHRFEFTTPDSFNGSLRVMAVAVQNERIGIASTGAKVRGDFVLSPSFPTAVAPGDRFVASVGVSYPKPESGAAPARDILVSLTGDAGLKVVAEAAKSIRLEAGAEGLVSFELEANAGPGARGLRFVAEADTLSASRAVSLSVRPLTPYLAELRVGRLKSAGETLDHLRDLWPDYMKRELLVAQSPLLLARGLDIWLGDFPHQCSEQLISRAMPLLADARHPGLFRSKPGAAELAGLFQTLQQRQNGQGGLGLWTATPEADSFVSAYAGLYFVEASERGLAVPSSLANRNTAYLRTLAGDLQTNALSDLRVRALATYVLTRRGQVTTAYLAALEQALESQFADTWKRDVTATLIAATYQQLKQSKEAELRMQDLLKRLSTPFTLDNWWNGYYDDPAIQDALSLYLIARHFPEILKRLPPSVQERLVGPIEAQMGNTLSSGLSVLALSEIAAAGKQDSLAGVVIESRDAAGKSRAIGSLDGWWQRAEPDHLARSLRIANLSPQPHWYVLTDNGFDHALPQEARNDGIELIRQWEFNATPGVLQQGDEVDVTLRVRGIGATQYNLAIIELLPGGFELVESAPDSSGGSVLGGTLIDRVRRPGSDLALEHLEVREDRIVLYANADTNSQTFRYRLKATSAGTFNLPPTHAAGMYDRRVVHTGKAGEVVRVE